MVKEFTPHEKIMLMYGSDIHVDSRSIYLLGTAAGEPLTHGDLEAVLKGIHFFVQKSDDPIDFYLITSGGEDEIGFAIYDAIKGCGVETNIYCMGKCYSMGTIILQAATNRFSYPSTIFMIHEGYYENSGWNTYESVRSDMDFAEKSIDKAYEIYVERTALTKRKLKALMKKGDYYFTAEEAVEMGFIDEIIE